MCQSPITDQREDGNADGKAEEAKNLWGVFHCFGTNLNAFSESADIVRQMSSREIWGVVAVAEIGTDAS